MLWLTGDRIVSAYAQTVDVRGLKHPDIGQTMFRFAGGATATLETVWCMPTQTPFDIDERMSIIGTEGIIHVQDTFRRSALSTPTSCTRLTSPTGRCSTGYAAGLCATSSAISPAVP